MSKISHKITIDAPAGRVFKVLSTADGLKGWYTPHLEGPIQPAGNALKVLALRQDRQLRSVCPKKARGGR